MATNKDLEARIKQLEAVIASVGLTVERTSDLPEDRPDYIAHGSPEHAAFIGLVILENPEDSDGRTVYPSKATGRIYCLEDEVSVLRYYPAIDPEKAAFAVLRQKVGAFEGGPPTIPDNAPTIWMPEPFAV